MTSTPSALPLLFTATAIAAACHSPTPQPRLLRSIVAVLVVIVIVTAATIVFPALSSDLFYYCVLFHCRVVSPSSSGCGLPTHHIHHRCCHRHCRGCHLNYHCCCCHLPPPLPVICLIVVCITTEPAIASSSSVLTPPSPLHQSCPWDRLICQPPSAVFHFLLETASSSHPF